MRMREVEKLRGKKYMKNLIKRLFCKHEYKKASSEIVYDKVFDYECYITYKYRVDTFVCMKCGKKKKEWTKIG